MKAKTPLHQRLGKAISWLGGKLSTIGTKTESAKGLGDLIAAQTEATKLDLWAEWLAVDVLGREGCGCPARKNKLNTLWPFSKPKLVIAIPEYNDRGGLWGMLHQLVAEITRYKLQDHVEIAIVTQTPTIKAPERRITNFGTPAEQEQVPVPTTVIAGPEPLKVLCKNFTARGVKVHYHEFTQVIGTSPAKRECIRVAASHKAEWVWICDSHLAFVPGSVHRFYKWVCKTKNRNSKHLYHCPLLYDGADGAFTGFETRKPNKLALVGGDNLWGQFRSETALFTEDAEPAEIQAHGGFWMATRVDVGLLTFGHPLFRGFGDPETVLHEQRRRAGHKVYCLPARIVSCWHRFLKVRHNDYHSPWTDALRNHLIGMLDLRVHLMKEAVAAGFEEPFEWMLSSWVESFPDRRQAIMETASRVQEEYAMWRAQTEHANAEAAKKRAEAQKASNATPASQQASETIDQRYDRLVKTPSDINEHLPKIKELASLCDHVVEFGTRGGASTTAIIAGKPKRVTTYDTNPACGCSELMKIASDVEVVFRHGPEFNTATMPVIDKCDMLLVDTLHTADHVSAELMRHSPSVKKFIVLHDTQAPWGQLDEGGGSGGGVTAGIARWTNSKQGAGWRLVYDAKNNHGLQVWGRE